MLQYSQSDHWVLEEAIHTETNFDKLYMFLILVISELSYYEHLWTYYHCKLITYFLLYTSVLTSILSLIVNKIKTYYHLVKQTAWKLILKNNYYNMKECVKKFITWILWVWTNLCSYSIGNILHYCWFWIQCVTNMCVPCANISICIHKPAETNYVDICM